MSVLSPTKTRQHRCVARLDRCWLRSCEVEDDLGSALPVSHKLLDYTDRLLQHLQEQVEPLLEGLMLCGLDDDMLRKINRVCRICSNQQHMVFTDRQSATDFLAMAVDILIDLPWVDEPGLTPPL
jgi:hypothetical protein